MLFNNKSTNYLCKVLCELAKHNIKTKKMGQYWNIVCMDKRQASGHLGKMGELLYRDAPDWLVNLLTTCKFAKLKLAPLPVKPTDVYLTKLVSSIEALPPEILDKICSFLPTTDDVLCFGLTCYQFLEIGRQNIIKREKTEIAPWAGKRIICIGDYARDYPESFLTQQERDEISEENMYHYVCDFFEKPVIYAQMWAYNYKRTYNYVKNSNLDANILEKLTHNIKPIYAKNSEYILRNLSTKEYVCANKIPKPAMFGLGHILIIQTCWSSDPSISMNYNDDITRGPWAGNRFDITTIENIDINWKDVSRETITKTKNIFDADAADRRG
jgi:hypothetical protein